MKKVITSPVSRIILITCSFLGLFFLSLVVAAVALKYLSKTDLNERESPGSDFGQLVLISGGQMASGSAKLITDVTAPNPALLPLKTLADFQEVELASRAAILTTKGELELILYPEQAPLGVANFLELARAGFYDGLKFHRVVPGFVVQIGDPASRAATNESELLELGTGYPGYRIADEVETGLNHDQVGVVSWANINFNGAYPHTGGSQFFITLSPAPTLNGSYSVFAQVTGNLEILPQLEVGDEIKQIKIP